MNEKLAYLLGVILHDAHLICRKDKGIYGFELEQKNREYIEYLRNLIKTVFGRDVKIETRKRSWGTYYRIRLHSKELHYKIKKYDFQKLLQESPKKIQTSLIRGLFDAEGSVSLNEVRIFSNNLNLLKSAKKVIESFGIKCGRIVISNKDVLQLPVYAKEHKNKFMKIFKPNHPQKKVSF